MFLGSVEFNYKTFECKTKIKFAYTFLISFSKRHAVNPPNVTMMLRTATLICEQFSCDIHVVPPIYVLVLMRNCWF